MKLKYYLRGLGTGLIVATLIVGISSSVSGNTTMTDEEILARAKELGLVERTVLADMVKKDETEETLEESQDTSETVQDTSETVQETVEEPEEVVEAESVGDTEETPVEQEEKPVVTEAADEIVTEEFGMPDEAGTITIKIAGGSGSDTVSRQLAEAGLVDSATAYDKYLCQNGYDKKIRVGTYEIPVNATGEEIAKMITGR